MTRLSACRRGYDRRWRRLRDAAITKQPWCTACRATTNLQGDHIIPLSRGGLTGPGNVQVLCRSCNASKAALIARTQLSLDAALAGIWAHRQESNRD